MYYTDNSILPENMEPLIITAAPYGPAWLPGDASDIALTWDEQVKAAVDCYNAGATMLHFHVRNPATGLGSTNMDDYNYLLKRVKEAVPEMIIQVGGQSPSLLTPPRQRRSGSTTTRATCSRN